MASLQGAHIQESIEKYHLITAESKPVAHLLEAISWRLGEPCEAVADDLNIWEEKTR